MKDRKEREADFHDHTFEQDTRKSLSVFYSIVDRCRSHFQQYLFSSCPGKKVLEYGCGKGSHSFLLANHGAREIVGIDISDVAVRMASERASAENHSNIRFQVMNCENMEFVDDSFDLICGTSILHHLDLNQSFKEITRVLKPDGRAAFVEPLAYHPALYLFRKLTPRLRTSDEHPFTMRDLRYIGSMFHNVSYRFFNLFTLLAVPFNKTILFNPILDSTFKLDSVLFDRLPLFTSLAWHVVMFLEDPKKDHTELTLPKPASLPD